jgi:riboflavin synthase
MFTGIIERTLPVLAVADGPRFRRLTLPNPWDDVKLGESIAVNGCCLTVAEEPDEQLAFDVIAETLDKTNLGALGIGDGVNVERSLRVGDRLDGHFVQGHVDGTGQLLAVDSDGDEWRLTVAAPPAVAKYLVPKGSVTVDGVSLTLAAVDGANFQVALIPTTLGLTTLGNKPVGWAFNLEADVMAKTIVSFLERRGTGPG